MSFHRFTPTACAALLACGPAQAQQTNLVSQLPTTFVTATRFQEPRPTAAANVTVISAEQISNSPATNLPDLLKAAAGIEVRAQYGNTGIDATVDIRGFGPTASSNTLILLDGQRLNPIDSSAVSWSSIPLASIERIEIMPGSGTVLFGDQASGGVINIITNKTLRKHASVTFEAGSAGLLGVDAHVATHGEDTYFNLFAHDEDRDGWRRNNKTSQQSVSGRMGIFLPNGEAFLDYGVYRDQNGAPGNLWSARYFTDPRQAYHPLDKMSRDGYRIRPGLALNLAPALKFEAEVTATSDNYLSGSYGSSGNSFNHRQKDALSFTPRLRWAHGLGTLDSVTVVGLDYYDAKVDAKTVGTNYATPNIQRVAQQSTSLYAQNITTLGMGWSINAGLRSQTMKQQVHQWSYVDTFFGFPNSNPALDGNTDRKRTAYDIGAVYETTSWRSFAKTGTTYRFANTDELFGFDPNTYVQFFAGDLKPQHGTIHEVGTRYQDERLTAKITAYRLDLNDEIGFDDGANVNVNFTKTRRQGIETELGWKLTSTLHGRLNYTYLDATFRTGTYSGKEVPLTSRQIISAQATWQGGAFGTYSAIARHVGDRRYGGDFTNSQGYLPGYSTLDLLASWDLKPWLITARLNNALDRRYATYGAYASWASDFYYAPADGRSIALSARYAFN